MGKNLVSVSGKSQITDVIGTCTKDFVKTARRRIMITWVSEAHVRLKGLVGFPKVQRIVRLIVKVEIILCASGGIKVASRAVSVIISITVWRGACAVCRCQRIVAV